MRLANISYLFINNSLHLQALEKMDGGVRRPHQGGKGKEKGCTSDQQDVMLVMRAPKTWPGRLSCGPASVSTIDSGAGHKCCNSRLQLLMAISRAFCSTLIGGSRPWSQRNL